MDTPKTASIISQEDSEEICRLLDIKEFLSETKDFHELGETEEAKTIFHQKLCTIVEEAVMSYQSTILKALDYDTCKIDEEHANIIAKALEELIKMFPDVSGGSDLKSRICRSVNLLLFELKNIFEDVINRWIKFYIREFWIMLELGITEFSTMNKYVEDAIAQGSNKLNKIQGLLNELILAFIRGVSRKVSCAHKRQGKR